MPAGLAYDLRECESCGALYDHVSADWNEDERADYCPQSSAGLRRANLRKCGECHE